MMEALVDDLVLLNEQITALQDRQSDAERHLLTLMAAATADVDEMRAAEDAYLVVKPIAGPSFVQTWRDTMPLPIGAFGRRASNRRRWDRRSVPNGPGGYSWVGTFPIDIEDPIPPLGMPVVYVLYAADGEPVYVGSSHHFRNRIWLHYCDGKVFRAWMAYPCADRETAYQLEDQLLGTVKPRLNVRACR